MKVVEGTSAPLVQMNKEQRVAHAVLLTAVLFLALVTIHPTLLKDGDTQWHIAVGAKIWNSGHLPLVDDLSYTFAGSPWIATQWLSELVYFAAYSLAGWSGVVALAAFSLATAFGLLFYWVERRLKWVTGLSLVLAVFIISSNHFLARPEVFILPLLVLFTGALVDAIENRIRPPLWLVPLMVLWANLHGSFPIAFVIFGILGAEALFSMAPGRRMQVIWQWGGLCLLLVGATAITPYGLKSLLVTLFVMQDGEAAKHIQEWQPLHFGPLSNFREALPFGYVTLAFSSVAACLAFMLLDPQRNLFRTLLVLVFAFLMVRHVRFANMYAFVSAFAVVYPISRIFPSLRPYPAAIPLSGTAVLGLTSLIVLAGFTVAGLSRPAPPPDSAPRAALNAARQMGLSGPIFNDFNFGGFVLASGIKTFIDGRTDQLFIHGFLERVHTAIDAQSPDRLVALLSDYNVSWALVNADGKTDDKLQTLSTWKRVYKDEYAAVYTRTKDASSADLKSGKGP